MTDLWTNKITLYFDSEMAMSAGWLAKDIAKWLKENFPPEKSAETDTLVQALVVESVEEFSGKHLKSIIKMNSKDIELESVVE